MQRHHAGRKLGLAAGLIIGLCGPWGLSARGEEGRPSTRDYSRHVEQSAEQRYREASAARELGTWLGLTQNQARQLVPLMEQACTLHIGRYETHAGCLDEMIQAFSAFAAEDSRNQGFTPEVEQQTAQTNHKAKDAQERITLQLMELETQAAEILTPTQLDFVEEYHPGRYRGMWGKDGKAGVRQYIAAAARRAHRESQRDDLMNARDELQALNQELHPHLEQVGKLLLHPAAALPICRLANVYTTETMDRALEVVQLGTEQYPMEWFDTEQARVQELRTEINNWNLINGLHLSTAQIGQIVGYYDNYAGQLKELKQQQGKQVRRQRNALLVELEGTVEQVLNAGQREVLADYKACLLPPKNLNNPVRVGQANDSSQHEKWLERARQAPEKRRERLIARLIEREAEHFGTLTPYERRQREKLLEDTVGEAAQLSDLDFALSKGDLAERITPRDRPAELKTKVETLARARGMPGVIAQFILKPEFIDQLRQRGQQLAAGYTR